MFATVSGCYLPGPTNLWSTPMSFRVAERHAALLEASPTVLQKLMSSCT